jgi:hypothetical protein
MDLQGVFFVPALWLYLIIFCHIYKFSGEIKPSFFPIFRDFRSFLPLFMKPLNPLFSPRFSSLLEKGNGAKSIALPPTKS